MSTKRDQIKIDLDLVEAHFLLTTYAVRFSHFSSQTKSQCRLQLFSWFVFPALPCFWAPEYGAPPCTPRQVGSEKGSIALEEKIAARRRLVFDPAHHESQGCEEQVFHPKQGQPDWCHFCKNAGSRLTRTRRGCTSRAISTRKPSRRRCERSGRPSKRRMRGGRGHKTSAGEHRGKSCAGLPGRSRWGARPEDTHGPKPLSAEARLRLEQESVKHELEEAIAKELKARAEAEYRTLQEIGEWKFDDRSSCTIGTPSRHVTLTRRPRCSSTRSRTPGPRMARKTRPRFPAMRPRRGLSRYRRSNTP